MDVDQALETGRRPRHHRGRMFARPRQSPAGDQFRAERPMRAALTLALLTLAGNAVAAPAPGAATPKGHYAELDKLPDWGGVWVLAPAPGPPPVPKGEYARKFAERKAFADANNGEFPRDF